MPVPRTILHLDLDAFFCAVEVIRDPSLDGKAFAVGGTPEGRGVVASCSYAARRFGVRSAMPMAQALRLCPGLSVVSHHGGYGSYSRKVMTLLDRVTPYVEQISIDECFIDVTDIEKPAERVARRIQAMIYEELKLPSSLGGATSKLVAKIATNVGKDRTETVGWPNAVLVVPPGDEPSFLAPMPVRAMWGVGPKTAERMESLGIITLGDLQNLDADELESKLGSYGRKLHAFSRGIDDRVVDPGGEAAKSISHETTFAEDIGEADRLHAVLLSLSQLVGRSLRDDELTCRTVAIKLRWADFKTITRRVTFRDGTDLDQDLYRAAKQLFDKAWHRGQRVRLLGVAASHLASSGQQLSLWHSGDDRGHRMQAALDSVRDKFGGKKTKWGQELKQREFDEEDLEEGWWEADA
jgi:DNA polymerase-4